MSFVYIANWKNFLTQDQELMLAQEYYDGLCTTPQDTHIIIMPSFLSITALTALFDATALSVGTQNCSAYGNGAYTGEISAQSIAKVGARYTLIGHLERRTLFGETDELVVQKFEQLVAHNITPILCVGGTSAGGETQIITDMLRMQLELPLTMARKHQLAQLLVAYEPSSAIGSGNAADADTISEVFTQIRELFKSAPRCTPVLLYGGSVNTKNCHELKKIAHLGGFLIGSASTTFATFEKIVHSH